MISLSSLRSPYLLVLGTTAVFLLLAIFSIQYQYFIWEIFIDLQIIFLLVALVVLRKITGGTVSWDFSYLLRWNWIGNIYWFLYPLVALAIGISLSFVINEIRLRELENTATLILQTVFDIPSMFIFSATTVLLEEFTFRSVLLRSYSFNDSPIRSAIVNAFFWTCFAVPGIIVLGNSDFQDSISILTFYFAVGILTSVLAMRFRTIWYGYSLRIGIMAAFPLLIVSKVQDSETFFTTESSIFSSEGYFYSVFFLISAVFIVKKIKHQNIEENQKVPNRNVFS